MSASQGQLVTAKSGSNLAAAFFLLPKAKRRAMVALYAFCRAVDEVADDDAMPLAKRAGKQVLRQIKAGEPQPLWPRL